MNSLFRSRFYTSFYRHLYQQSATRLLTTNIETEWKKQHLSGPQAGAPMPENLTIRQRRIIYRSKQRGWLELDILFGGWCVKHIPDMKEEASIQLVEQLLDADTPNVLKWILKQEKIPKQFDNHIMHSLQEFAAGDGLVKER